MKYFLLVMIAFSLVSLYSLDNTAYGSFDTNGKYYCDPTNIGLEKTIYALAVSKLNNAIDDYLSLEPNPTSQELHDFIAHSSSGTTEPTFDIINQAKVCLTSNNIDPLSVAEPISLSKLAYAPEFSIAIPVLLISIITLMVLLKMKPLVL